MKEYVLSVVITAAFAGGIIAFTPSGRNGGMEKHMKLLTALALICVTVSPLISFLTSLKDFRLSDISVDSFANTEKIEADRVFSESLAEYSCRELETQLESILCREFSVDKRDIAVTCEYGFMNDGLSVELKRTVVCLYGIAIFKDPYGIEARVSELTGVYCDCIVGEK